MDEGPSLYFNSTTIIKYPSFDSIFTLKSVIEP